MDETTAHYISDLRHETQRLLEELSLYEKRVAAGKSILPETAEEQFDQALTDLTAAINVIHAL